MSELRLILLTYAQYYRRHRGLLVLFLIGLSLGSALLSATLGLNQEASKRYQTSTALLAQPVSDFIRPPLGKTGLPFSLWQRLSAAGFEQAHPVLEGRLRSEDDKLVAIRGINLLQWQTAGAAKPVSGDAGQPHSDSPLFDTLFMSPELTAKLQLNASALRIKGGSYPVSQLEGAGHYALMDISLADRLLNAQGQISYFEVTGLNALQRQQLVDMLGSAARLESAEAQTFDALSGAFFFNLQALALLGYVVGAFLSLNAIKLAYQSRLSLQQQMATLGCRQSQLLKALCLEVAILSVLAATLGNLLGVLMANAMMGDISTVLSSFYQLDRALTVRFDAVLVLIGSVLNLVILAGFVVLQTRLAQQLAKWLTLALLSLACVGGLLLLHLAQTKWQALLLCVCVLLVFFALTPPLVRLVFQVRWPTRAPLLGWLRADSLTQLPALLSSVLAILMAMGAAIGMQVMVGSFSSALDTHLQTRLNADLYVRPDNPTAQMRQALADMQAVKQVGIYWSAQSEVHMANETVPVTLMSFGEDHRYHQHLTLLNKQPLEAVHLNLSNDSIPCLVNEPGMRRYGLVVGSQLEVLQGQHAFHCQITGVFYDYGEPGMSLVVSNSVITQQAFLYEAVGFMLTLHEGVDSEQLADVISQHWSLAGHQLIHNQVFKRFAKQLFSQTFLVTHALNICIMLIALFGVWVSFLTLGRQQLQPMAVLQTLGVTQGQLLVLKLSQAGLILGLTLFLAVPLGILLGWVLLTYVMPIAFGWSMAMVLSWRDIWGFCAVVLLLALVVSAIPLLKLIRRNVADNVAQL
ncbi:ABC transporter permease [Pseudoalteromonas ardens]|uniref:ABC transporter permease n=1 Tax=Pseudoalteromonas rubra TaxID=43658 RepID=A0A0L0EP91_9GAMM|nr:ABC transporter permease [Pseudoalteromonas sp. R96]KNC66302.1 ABC transporter permease [Pseudoalteromonas rubra]MDK1313048.1 ABC transporter permease [Pseudoalteromonas sp. R96]